MTIIKKRIIFSIILFLVTFSIVYYIRQSKETHYILPTASENAIHLAENPPIPKGEIPILTALNKEYAAIMEAVVPSVVSIDTIRTIQTPQSIDKNQITYKSQEQKSLGSGVIVSKEGHILTNNHVIEGKQSIQITLWNGEKYSATRVGQDKLMDLAVLKIEATHPLKPLPFGNSDKIHVGEIVFAIGNPYGLGETVTRGIISAKQRNLGDAQSDLIQTDASVNPGNSGGPLINVYGEIIGLNTWVYSTKSNSKTEGLGFAIPSNLAKKVFEQICQWGKPKRGYIGLLLLDLTDQIKNVLHYNNDYGVAINEMHPNAPAGKLGLKPGDIILSFNGKNLNTARELLYMIHDAPIGENVKLKVWSNGTTKEISVPIMEAGVPLAEIEKPLCPRIEQLKGLGVDIRDVNLEEYAGGLRGVLITKVSPETSQVLRVSDVIEQVNSHPITNKSDLCKYLNPKDFNTLRITRGRYVFDIRISFKKGEYSDKECPIKEKSHYLTDDKSSTLGDTDETTDFQDQ